MIIASTDYRLPRLAWKYFSPLTAFGRDNRGVPTVRGILRGTYYRLKALTLAGVVAILLIASAAYASHHKVRASLAGAIIITIIGVEVFHLIRRRAARRLAARKVILLTEASGDITAEEIIENVREFQGISDTEIERQIAVQADELRELGVSVNLEKNDSPTIAIGRRAMQALCGPFWKKIAKKIAMVVGCLIASGRRKITIFLLETSETGSVPIGKLLGLIKDVRDRMSEIAQHTVELFVVADENLDAILSGAFVRVDAMQWKN